MVAEMSRFLHNVYYILLFAQLLGGCNALHIHNGRQEVDYYVHGNKGNIISKVPEILKCKDYSEDKLPSICLRVNVQDLLRDVKYDDYKLFSIVGAMSGYKILIGRIRLDTIAEFFGICISNEQLMDIITKKDFIDKYTETQKAIIISAVGYKKEINAIPLVVAAVKEAKTLHLKIACIRTLGLLGYKKTIDVIIKTLNEYGVDSEKYTLNSILKALASGRQYSINKIVNIMSISDMKKQLHYHKNRHVLQLQLLAACAEAYIRVNIRENIGSNKKERLGYYLISLGKSNEMLLVVDNWTDRCLKRDGYFYNGEYIIDGKHIRNIVRPVGIDANGEIRPYTMEYRIIDIGLNMSARFDSKISSRIVVGIACRQEHVQEGREEPAGRWAGGGGHQSGSR